MNSLNGWRQEMKVKVIETICPYFTAGRIYEVIQGSTTAVLVKDDENVDNVLYLYEVEVVEE